MRIGRLPASCQLIVDMRLTLDEANDLVLLTGYASLSIHARNGLAKFRARGGTPVSLRDTSLAQ